MKWTLLVGGAGAYFLLLVGLAAYQIRSGVDRISRVNLSQQQPRLSVVSRPSIEP